jgi:glucuronokinase
LATTFARAALAGNPSDAFGGRTVAVCLVDWAAEAEFRPAPSLRVEPDEPDLEHLVRAALTRLTKIGALAAAAGEVRVQTSIPAQVGLGGSSAIVISVMRAAAACNGAKLEPAVLAAEALAAETQELGIAAGPQDRVIQSHGGLLDMDFASGRYEALDPALLPPLLVAHRRHPARHSGESHADLRRRVERGDQVVVAGLAELAAAAARAADALCARNRDDFAAAMDASFDLRAQIMDLDPAEAEGIHIARRHGAAANYAGSGGAVVVLPPGGAELAITLAFEEAGWDARPLHVTEAPAPPAPPRSRDRRAG